ncbi:MAG: hypothetical protein AAGG75_20845 [Bacteroidota bacterium]
MLTNIESLPATSRVWIYQSSRQFTAAELPELQQYLHQFVDQWVSHNQALRGSAKVFHHRFIVLMVDESMAGASGCSIDKSVHFIKALEAQFKVDLFDRMTFSYMDGEEVKTAKRAEFVELYRNGQINDQTLVFDNLVTNKGDFDQKWTLPLGQSWHRRMV